MINRNLLLEVLKANDIQSSYSKEEVKNFLGSLHWTPSEQEEAIEFLKTQGWLFEDSYKSISSKEAAHLILRKKIMLFLKSFFYKQKIKSVPKKVVVFNTMSVHKGALEGNSVTENPGVVPQVKYSLESRKRIIRFIKFILTLAIFLAIAYLLYLLRFDLTYYYQVLFS